MDQRSIISKNMDSNVLFETCENHKRFISEKRSYRLRITMLFQYRALFDSSFCRIFGYKR